MPMYPFQCQGCSHGDELLLSIQEHDKLEHDAVKGSAIGPEKCPKCGEVMLQVFALVHTQVGHDWDAQPWSKTFKEHNERLKRREGSGYDYVRPTDKIREKFTGSRFKNS